MVCIAKNLGLFAKMAGILAIKYKKDCDTMWLSTQACIYRSNIIKKE